MKNTYTITTSALALATLAMTLTPGAAQAATFRQNPDAGITKVWQQNPEKYGQPTSNEECVTGSGCAQSFENAVITWSRTTGVKVLNGAERAAAYKEAGGIAALGALESDAWNHSYCGTSVTTFNGKNQSRWLVVLEDDKGTAGTALDLNSEEGRKWKAERDQTRECFDTAAENPAPVEEPKPTPATEVVPQKYIDRVNSLAKSYERDLLGKVTSPLKKEADQLWVQRHEYASIVYNARDQKVVLVENATLDYALQHLDQFGLPVNEIIYREEDGREFIRTTFQTDELHRFQFRIRNQSELVYVPYTATVEEPWNFKSSAPIFVASFTDSRPAPTPPPVPQPTIPEGYQKPTIPITPNNPKDTTKSDLENAAITIDKLVASTTEFSPSQPVGEVTHRGGVYYTQDFGNNISAIYSSEQNKAIWMNTDAVTEYLTKPGVYGSYLWLNQITVADGQPTIQAVTMQNSELKYNWEDDGSLLYSAAESKALFYLPVSLDWINGAYAMYHGQNPTLVNGFPDHVTGRVYDENLPVDTTYDWSNAQFIELPRVLRIQADGKDWYIKATVDGKPLPGAKPVASNMLLESYLNSDRPRLANYADWAFGGDYQMYNNLSMLGAPVGEEVEYTDEQGMTTVTQEFEGGTATWYKGTEFLGASLNEVGEAKKAWYDSLGI